MDFSHIDLTDLIEQLAREEAGEQTPTLTNIPDPEPDPVEDFLLRYPVVRREDLEALLTASVPRMAGEGTCPTCNHTHRTYRRPLNLAQAEALRWLHASYEVGEYVHITTVVPRDTLRQLDWSKMAHWGLLAPRPSDETSAYKGWWGLTSKGAAFARGEIKVPSHVELLRNEVVGFSDTLVSIGDILPEDIVATAADLLVSLSKGVTCH